MCGFHFLHNLFYTNASKNLKSFDYATLKLKVQTEQKYLHQMKGIVEFFRRNAYFLS